MGIQARLVKLEIMSEFDLEDVHQLPNDLIAEFQRPASPMLDTTMPNQTALILILRLWSINCGYENVRVNQVV